MKRLILALVVGVGLGATPTYFLTKQTVAEFYRCGVMATLAEEVIRSHSYDLLVEMSVTNLLNICDCDIDDPNKMETTNAADTLGEDYD